MNSIESFKHLSDVGESGARWLAGRRPAKSLQAVAMEMKSKLREAADRYVAAIKGRR